MKYSFKRDRINWAVVAGLLFFHLGAIPAFFCFSWTRLAMFLLLFWMSNGLGVCLCYHRYFTHKGFEMPKWLEYVFTVMGTLTSQGGPISWVATHRYHHANSDAEMDPHSPRHGFLWAHMLWFVYRVPMFEDPIFYERYAPELAKDRFYRFLFNYSWIPQVVLGIGLFLWDGLPMVFWGICLRTVCALHVTWLVNSATHKWGYRNFETKDDSTNLWWVAIPSFGEGWHNNHHAFQRSAAHGMHWWEFDATYLFIKFLALLGLATSIQNWDNQGRGNYSAVASA